MDALAMDFNVNHVEWFMNQSTAKVHDLPAMSYMTHNFTLAVLNHVKSEAFRRLWMVRASAHWSMWALIDRKPGNKPQWKRHNSMQFARAFWLDMFLKSSFAKQKTLSQFFGWLGHESNLLIEGPQHRKMTRLSGAVY